MRHITLKPLILISAVSIVSGLLPQIANAADAPAGNFAIQVTPSPIVQIVKPGVPSELDLQVRNNGLNQEQLKMEVHSFTFDSTTGGVQISNAVAPDTSQWVKFANPRFTIDPGEVYTQKINFNFPSNSGFSSSFAIIINRQIQMQATSGGRLLNGAVADFGLVNIDKPGATAGISVTSFKTSSPIYEYVPATLQLRLKNTGNTIVKPLGNIFVQRGSNDANPIDTLEINQGESYILPNTERTINATWGDGFPSFQTQTLSDGTTKTKETWNFADLSKFRIGRYTAKAVVVYNNGTFDVPLNAETTFWILPWKIILGALIILLIIGFGVFAVVRSIIRTIGHGKNKFKNRR